MGPTENNNDQAAGVPGAGLPSDGSAMPPAPSTPPAGGVDSGAAATSWPPAPAAPDAGAVGGAPAPNPEEVSMGDETPVVTPEVPAAPAAPAEPAVPADGGDEAPTDPGAGMPGAAPQQ